MDRHRTGIEELLREKINRTIFAPVSDEELDRSIIWIKDMFEADRESLNISKDYMDKHFKSQPKKYTTFSILKKAEIIEEEGDIYHLSQTGVAIYVSLRREGVFDPVNPRY